MGAADSSTTEEVAIMAEKVVNKTDWVAVAARAQAYQAIHLAGLSDKSVTEKAKFLMVLGLTRSDAAVLLGTTEDSLRHLLRPKGDSNGKADTTGKAASGE
jgi:hypothetical protein